MLRDVAAHARRDAIKENSLQRYAKKRRRRSPPPPYSPSLICHSSINAIFYTRFADISFRHSCHYCFRHHLAEFVYNSFSCDERETRSVTDISPRCHAASSRFPSLISSMTFRLQPPPVFRRCARQSIIDYHRHHPFLRRESSIAGHSSYFAAISLRYCRQLRHARQRFVTRYRFAVRAQAWCFDHRFHCLYFPFFAFSALLLLLMPAFVSRREQFSDAQKFETPPLFASLRHFALYHAIFSLSLAPLRSSSRRIAIFTRFDIISAHYLLYAAPDLRSPSPSQSSSFRPRRRD